MNRPAMREMLAYIDANPDKKFVVVFDDLKRFARDTVFHLKLRSSLKARDVVPRCLNYNFDDSPEGMFVETVLAAGNELERHQNRRQVIQKQKARIEAGYWPFGAKRGYIQIKDALHGKLCVPSKDGIEILKPALEAFAHGTFVRQMDLARHLVSKGFWSCSPEKCLYILSKMLRDPFYVGDIEYLAWEVSRRTGHHQGIIELETFDLIQKRLRKDDFGTRIRLDINPDFPLRDLLLCDHCDKHLTAAWSKGRTQKHAYYICRNKECLRYGKSVKKKDIESQFYEILKKNTLKESVGKLVYQVFDKVWKEEMDLLRKDAERQKQKEVELQEQARELTRLVIKAKTDAMRHMYESQAEDIANELLEIEENQIEIDLSVPYRTALGKAVVLLKKPHAVWSKLTLTEQHQLFYFIFEQKLRYNQETGYRTAQIPHATRLFEEFVDTNSHDVEMGRVELPCEEEFRVALRA